MKRLIFFLIIICLFIAFPAYAHRGRTDEYGGHYDNDTGEYHYHHGYSVPKNIDYCFIAGFPAFFVCGFCGEKNF